jgi:hypothetical protein
MCIAGYGTKQLPEAISHIFVCSISTARRAELQSDECSRLYTDLCYVREL